MSECKYFNMCSAPLCPMSEQSLKNGLWYPDEEVCRLRRFASCAWVRKQKKISNKAGVNNGYFTVETLRSIKAVKCGIKGIDPDKKVA